MERHNLSELYQRAKGYMLTGYDEVYIANQLAEDGVDNETIDKVVAEIKKANKKEKQASGLKLLIYGATFIVVGFGLTWWSTRWDSEHAFIVWGLPVVGVLLAVKGLARIIGLL